MYDGHPKGHKTQINQNMSRIMHHVMLYHTMDLL